MPAIQWRRNNWILRPGRKNIIGCSDYERGNETFSKLSERHTPVHISSTSQTSTSYDSRLGPRRKSWQRHGYITWASLYIQLTSSVYKGFESNLFNTKDLITKKGPELGSRGIFSISNTHFSEFNLVGYAINNNSYTWRLPPRDEDSHFSQEPGLAPDNMADVKATRRQKAETVCYVT